MTWRKMMIQGELKVRRVMKRRGNVENSEEFTGAYSVLRRLQDMYVHLLPHVPSSPLTTISIDLRPNATDALVLRAGHWGVAGFAIFMAAFATMLHGVKIDLGFV